jgi:hypothetical protein
VDAVLFDSARVDPDRVVPNRVPPTYKALAMAAPPAVVSVPPLVLLVASVVFEIPIPPASVSAPVVFDVDAVDPDSARVLLDTTLQLRVDVPNKVRVDVLVEDVLSAIAL